MDFYIDGGGGGSTGGYPTGWNPGTPGVTGGGGTVGGFSGGGLTVPAYAPPVPTSSFTVPSSFFNVATPKSAPDDELALQAEYGITPMPYSGVQPTIPTYNGPIGDSGWIDLLNTRGSVYKGTTYYDRIMASRGSNAPQLNAYYDELFKSLQSQVSNKNYADYQSWLSKQDPANDPAVQQGLLDYANNQSIATPKPFMPNGAPDASSAVSAEAPDAPEFPQLQPYNPLKSDWNGKADLSGLMKGLMGLFMGGDRADVAPAKQFESPQYGLLAKSNVNPQEAADPFKSANNQWQRTVDLKPKEYESSYLDNYVDPYVPKLEKQIGMPSLDIASPSMFANQGLLSGMAQQSSKNETAKSKSIVDENRESVSDAINNARDRVKGLSWKQLA